MFSIRPGWFYHQSEDSKVKSLASLADIYFKSVGRNSVLLLNIPPDRRGRIAEADVARLQQPRAFLDQLYATDYINSATITVSSQSDATHGENQLHDGRPGYLLDARLAGQTNAQVGFDLGRTLAPSMSRASRRLSPWASACRPTTLMFWRTANGAPSPGRVIGQKQLRRFPAVTARKVRLVIDQACAPPAISEFGLHFNFLALAGSGAD